MRLSVVIPTLERPGMLVDCLKTLQGQSMPSESFEVIVVDDGSSSPLDEALRPFADDGLNVRCVHQPRLGLNAARNRGVEESAGEVVAFLDDDTLVHAGWAQAMLDAFATTRCAAIGGRISLRLDQPAPRWLTPGWLTYLSQYDLGAEPVEVRGPPLPFGANFAVRRSVLKSIDPFRAGLDRMGAELTSNGEIELLERVMRAGGRVYYWPAASVVHRIPAGRVTKDWFRRRAFAQGLSDVRSEHPRGPYAILRARESVRMARALPILVRRGRFSAELWLAYSRGRVAELRHQHGHGPDDG